MTRPLWCCPHVGWFVAVFLALGAQTAAAQGSATAGKTKSVTCAACHGADGNSANPEWPSLAGQHGKYTIRQLEAYQLGQRSNVLMSAMAMLTTPAKDRRP